jgi:hypothetical protein
MHDRLLPSFTSTFNRLITHIVRHYVRRPISDRSSIMAFLWTILALWHSYAARTIDIYPNMHPDAGGNMGIPNSRGEYPARFGGDMMPPESEVPRGAASAAWMAQLLDDCPADRCPWWPDVRNASLAATAAANQEAWIMSPGAPQPERILLCPVVRS